MSTWHFSGWHGLPIHSSIWITASIIKIGIAARGTLVVFSRCLYESRIEIMVAIERERELNNTNNPCNNVNAWMWEYRYTSNNNHQQRKKNEQSFFFLINIRRFVCEIGLTGGIFAYYRRYHLWNVTTWNVFTNSNRSNAQYIKWPFFTSSWLSFDDWTLLFSYSWAANPPTPRMIAKEFTFWLNALRAWRVFIYSVWMLTAIISSTYSSKCFDVRLVRALLAEPIYRKICKCTWKTVWSILSTLRFDVAHVTTVEEVSHRKCYIWCCRCCYGYTGYTVYAALEFRTKALYGPMVFSLENRWFRFMWCETWYVCIWCM